MALKGRHYIPGRSQLHDEPPRAAPAPKSALPPAMVRVDVKGAGLVKPLAPLVHELTITSEEEYQAADELRAAIAKALKSWEADMEGILAPLRQSKSAADALKRKHGKPLEELLTKVTETMRQWKVAEAQRIEQAKAKQLKTTGALRQQLEQTALREQTARTTPVRQRMAVTREHLEQRLAEEEANAPAPVQSEHSRTRTKREWRFVGSEEKDTPTDDQKTALLGAILEGHIPLWAVSVDFAALNRHWMSPEGKAQMEQWPGLEGYDHIIIASK